MDRTDVPQSFRPDNIKFLKDSRGCSTNTLLRSLSVYGVKSICLNGEHWSPIALGQLKHYQEYLKLMRFYGHSLGNADSKQFFFFYMWTYLTILFNHVNPPPQLNKKKSALLNWITNHQLVLDNFWIFLVSEVG